MRKRLTLFLLTGCAATAQARFRVRLTQSAPMRHLLSCCLLFLARLAAAQADYYVKFPDDIIVTSCGTQPIYTPPQLFHTNGTNVIIDYTDEMIDVVEDACYTIPPFFADSTPNNPQLWNAPYWFDPMLQTNNLSDAPVELSITASDDCSGFHIEARYLLFLDTDQDGIMETVINSYNPPAAGQVNFSNLSNPGFAGGTPQDFDQRAVDASLKYQFGVQTTVKGNYRTFKIGWHTEQTPNLWIPLQLPVGRHKIKWFISDACGNATLCEYLFMVVNSNLTAYHTLPSSPARPIRVYPNPAPNAALLRLENLAVPAGRFDLYDARGQFVWSGLVSGNQLSLEAAGLPTGMYFFKIFARGKMQGTGKLGIY